MGRRQELIQVIKKRWALTYGAWTRAALVGAVSVTLLAACSTADDVPQEVDDVVEPGVSARLEPGAFQSPLVRLKRLQGQNGHLHVDEVEYRDSDKKLFQCSYTFAVVDAANPASMSYLAENIRHKIPDDERTPGCIHLAADGDIVYTTHRGNIRNPAFLTGWDISKTDPEDEEKLVPEQLPVVQEPGVRYEGVDVANGVIYVAIGADGLGAYRRDPETNVISRIGSLGGLGSTWGLVAQDSTVVLTDLAGNLVTVDVTDPENPKLLGKVAVGGVPRGLAMSGDTAYVAAGSVGLVVVDVSDATNPTVLSTADTPGTAIRVAVSDGTVVVADWNDTRVYDVSDPANPTFIDAVRLTTDVVYPEDDGRPPVTARTLGAAINGNDVYVGNWWVMYSYRLYPDRTAPHVVLPEDASAIDFGPVASGETATRTIAVKNDGTAPLTLFKNWTTSSEFSVTPEQLLIEPGEEAELTVAYAATGSDRQTSLLNMWTDDPKQPTRSAFLVGNQPGLGIGKPLPETKLTLLDGDEWSTAAGDGNVMVLAYFATF